MQIAWGVLRAAHFFDSSGVCYRLDMISISTLVLILVLVLVTSSFV